MKIAIRSGLVAILLMSGFAMPACAAPIDDAVAAGDRGDYETALRLLRPARRTRRFGCAIRSRGDVFCRSGRPKDAAEAAVWFRKSAEQGDSTAQYNLGAMYDHGYGVAQSDADALKWYGKSAEQNYPPAQNNLGGFVRPWPRRAAGPCRGR